MAKGSGAGVVGVGEIGKRGQGSDRGFDCQPLSRAE